MDVTSNPVGKRLEEATPTSCRMAHSRRAWRGCSHVQRPATAGIATEGLHMLTEKGARLLPSEASNVRPVPVVSYITIMHPLF